MELRLTDTQYRVIIGNCYDGLPNESCGLLVGPTVDGVPTGVVTEARPAVNADASARTYSVASKDMLRAMRSAEEHSCEIVGVWHSHTHTDPFPSPTDVRTSVDPSWMYVIVSLKHGAPMLLAYNIANDTITELSVAIVRD